MADFIRVSDVKVINADGIQCVDVTDPVAPAVSLTMAHGKGDYTGDEAQAIIDWFEAKVPDPSKAAKKAKDAPPPAKSLHGR